LILELCRTVSKLINDYIDGNDVLQTSTGDGKMLLCLQRNKKCNFTCDLINR